MNLKNVVGCFTTIVLVAVAFANLSNADAGFTSDIKILTGEDVKIYKRIDSGTLETKELDDDVAQCLRDIAVIKSSQRNQEKQLKNHQRIQEQRSKDQMIILREILERQKKE